MRIKLRHSYFGRLFFYYILSSVLLIALTGFMILTLSSASVQRGMRNQTQSGVRAVAESLDDLLENCAELIRELAADGTVAGYLNGAQGVTRYDVARILYLGSVNAKRSVAVHVIRIGDGEIVSTGAVSPVFEKENYDEAYTLFKRILETQDVALYTTVKGIRMQGGTRLILAKAVRNALGQPQGYVAVEVSRDALESVVSNYTFVSSRPILIVDAYDTVLYHSAGDGGEGLNKLGPRSDFSPIWNTDASGGALEPDNLCWAKVDAARYAVVSEVGAELLSSIRSSTSTAVPPVLLTAFAIAIAFAYIVARTVSAPIRRLTLAMREVEKGNFRSAVPVTSRDEIGRLSEAFNHMQRKIEGLIERIEEKQRSLRVAEMGALSLQVNPHFLYNTLDLIKWCIKLERPGEAINVVVRLGKLLRRLMNNKADVVRVADELELVRAYLDIQKCRHQDKLDIRFDIDEDICGAQIPKLILQPLIENAIVHGLENKAEGGFLLITGRRADGYLRFVVADDGCGMDEEKLASVQQMRCGGMYNIGLANVHSRARLYGDETCGLTVESALGRGTTITLILKDIGGMDHV